VDNEKRGLNSILEEDKPEPEAKIENDLFSIDKMILIILIFIN